VRRDRAAILRLLREGRSFVITSHVNPDGDSVASQCALRLALRALGKRADVVNSHPVPRVYRFLPGTASFRSAPPRSWRGRDALIALDCGDARRASGLLQPRPPVPVVNIDHHASNPGYGDLNWVDARASSTAEIVHDLIAGLGVRVDGAIAGALYAGVLTDTGSFRHSNTTPRTLRLASRLVAAGADPARTAQAVYDSALFETLHALGRTLAGLQRTPDGRVAWITLPRRTLAGLASPAEAEEWVSFPRSVATAGVALCFKEAAPREIRVSLRSRDGVDVAALAARWGGGGHRNAAGATVRAPLAAAVREVVAAAQALVGGRPGATDTNPARPRRALARR
jgi:phosphoesterase RecJ-like protein